MKQLWAIYFGRADSWWSWLAAMGIVGLIYGYLMGFSAASFSHWGKGWLFIAAGSAIGVNIQKLRKRKKDD